MNNQAADKVSKAKQLYFSIQNLGKRSILAHQSFNGVIGIPSNDNFFCENKLSLMDVCKGIDAYIIEQQKASDFILINKVLIFEVDSIQ